MSPRARRPRLAAPLAAALALAAAGCSSDSAPAPADTAADTHTGDTASDTTAPTASIVINEIQAYGSDDWVELYNTGDAAVDLGGWVLRDDDPTHTYTFGPSSVVPPGVYYLLARDPDLGFDFGLGDADSVLLYDGDVLVDAVTWTAGEAPAGMSYGRFPNGSGPFGSLFAPSPGAPNAANPAVECGDGAREGFEVCDGADFAGSTCASLGFAGGALTCADSCTRVSTQACTALGAALVINELSAVGDDRIELFNGTAAAVDLTGWSLSDAAANLWIFAPATTVAPGAYLVLVKDVDHDFGLGGDDALELRDASDAVVDRTDWADGQADPAWCRVPNATGGFQTCPEPSFGAANPAL